MVHSTQLLRKGKKKKKKEKEVRRAHMYDNTNLAVFIYLPQLPPWKKKKRRRRRRRTQSDGTEPA